MEERVGRLEAASSGTTAGIDLTRQRDVVQDTDYEQSPHSERGRQARQDREAGRRVPGP